METRIKSGDMSVTVSELREQGYTVFIQHKRAYLPKNPTWKEMWFANPRSFDGWRNALHMKVPKKYSLLSRTEAKHKDNKGKTLHEKGGLTIVQLTSPEGVTVEAQAGCYITDNFNRQRGLAIALGRALHELQEPEMVMEVSKLTEVTV